MAEEGGRGPPVNAFQVVAAVVVVAAVLIGYLVATSPPTLAPPEAVGPGDRVDVDYIGFFEDGRVFDTTFQAVAENNASYPKAAIFTYRATYSPFTFTLGDTGAGSVIPGFENGLLEPTPMRVGETREIVIPPESGYGFPDPTRIEERPLRESFSQLETLTATDFSQRFDEAAVEGLVVPHPVWGWFVTVLEAQGGFVTLMHLVEEGLLARPYDAWPARVVEVETEADDGRGRVVVEHLLDVSHVDVVQGQDDGGTFRVVAVDPAGGTYTVDYNPELLGRTLIFRLTLLRIRG